jgi:biopolymer transport protein ExbD
LTLVSAFASGNKKEKLTKDDLNLNIQIDKAGELHINGKNIDDKAIEEWLNTCLKKVSIEINDEQNKKHKKIELSLTVKEK